MLGDFPITGDDGQSSRGRRPSNQPNNQLVGGRSGTGEANVDPSAILHLIGLWDSVTDQENFLSTKSAPF